MEQLLFSTPRLEMPQTTASMCTKLECRLEHRHYIFRRDPRRDAVNLRKGKISTERHRLILP
jgi:hypothetical protein